LWGLSAIIRLPSLFCFGRYIGGMMCFQQAAHFLQKNIEVTRFNEAQNPYSVNPI